MLLGLVGSSGCRLRGIVEEVQRSIWWVARHSRHLPGGEGAALFD